MSRPRELDMVVLRRHRDGTPAVWCDPEIADIVGALNNGGVPTRASCSGHGIRPGNIALADGRELIVAADWHEARKVEAAFPPFTNPDDDRHAFAPVDLPDVSDPDTCRRCGEGRFHPSHLDPREGLDPDEQPSDGSGACPGPAPPQTAHDDAPQPNCPECGHEADSRSRAIEVAAAGIPTQYVSSDRMRRKIAEGCIDDALHSGHLITREHCDDIRHTEHHAAWQHAREMEHDAAEAKRERDEALASKDEQR